MKELKHLSEGFRRLSPEQAVAAASSDDNAIGIGVCHPKDSNLSSLMDFTTCNEEVTMDTIILNTNLSLSSLVDSTNYIGEVTIRGGRFTAKLVLELTPRGIPFCGTYRFQKHKF